MPLKYIMQVLVTSEGNLKFKYPLYQLIHLFMESKNMFASFLYYIIANVSYIYLCCHKNHLTICIYKLEHPSCSTSWWKQWCKSQFYSLLYSLLMMVYMSTCNNLVTYIQIDCSTNLVVYHCNSKSTLHNYMAETLTAHWFYPLDNK